MGGKTPIQEPPFDPILFDVRHVLDIGLKSRRELMGGSNKKHRWYASNIGYCLRRQYLQRLGVPALKDGDDGLRTLWLGDIVHRAVQLLMRDSGLLLAEEQHLVDDELEASCYIDLIWGGKIQPVEEGFEQEAGVFAADFVAYYRERLEELYEGTPFPVTVSELKTAHTYSAQRMYTDGPSYHHVVQAGTTRLLLERNTDQLPDTVQGEVERFDIVVLDKSSLKIITFPIYPHAADTAEERIGRLNDYWKEEILPPCTCGKEQGMSWEARYCPYRDPNSSTKSPTCCDGSLESLAPQEEATADA